MTKQKPPPRRILRPDVDVLRRQCEVEKTPIENLTRLYGYSDVSNIYAWCRKWGITPYRHPRPTDHLRALELTPDQHQVVLGTLLGDGSIRQSRDPRNAGKQLTLALTQGEKQHDYLEWKKGFLAPFVLAMEPRRVAQRGHGIGGFRYEYTTIAHPAFTEYRRVFYPEGVKRITDPVLRCLGPRALAFWLMDDGSFHRSRGYIYLSTNSFALDDLRNVADWFAATWGIRPYIHSAGRFGQFHLAFNRSTSDALRDLVRPFFFESLLYKIGC